MSLFGGKNSISSIYQAITDSASSDNGMKSILLCDEAASVKRSGDLIKAKSMCKEAMRIAPLNGMAYFGIGKICYLLREREEALKNYLITEHMSIISLKAKKDQKSQEGEFIRELISDRYQVYSQLIADAPPDAIFLILDPNTPSHYAHADIDLSENSDAFLSRSEQHHSEIYRDVISGDQNSVLAIDIVEWTDFDIEKFYTYGVRAMTKEIKWDKLGFIRPYDLY